MNGIATVLHAVSSLLDPLKNKAVNIYRFVQYTFAMRWMAPPAEEILDVFDTTLFCPRSSLFPSSSSTKSTLDH